MPIIYRNGIEYGGSSGSNYIAGDGIDITSDVISVDSNLTVSGNTAYLDYTKPQGLTSFGKNLNPFPYEMTPTSTLPNPNGNFRYDIENGIIILNGYASMAPNYLLHNRDGFKLPVGTYILSDGWSTRNWGGLYLSLKDSSDTVIQQDLATTWSGPSQFTITEELYEQYDHIQLGIYINNNTNYSGVTVYPMIRHAQITSDLWDPYRQVIPQEQLVSGINIKTVNNSNILGSGNLSVGTVKGVTLDGTSIVNNNNIAVLTSGTNVKTINNQSIFGSGNINTNSLIYQKHESSYTTVSANTSSIPIGITGYQPTDILFVDADGLTLTEGIDYTINNSTNYITLTNPIESIGVVVHFTALRSGLISGAISLDSLKGDATDIGTRDNEAGLDDEALLSTETINKWLAILDD